MESDGFRLCVGCEKSDREIPILSFYFKGEERFICTSCLPTLLHRPGKLADRLIGAENIEPAQHGHK
jgi:hypothetical protein